MARCCLPARSRRFWIIPRLKSNSTPRSCRSTYPASIPRGGTRFCRGAKLLPGHFLEFSGGSCAHHAVGTARLPARRYAARPDELEAVLPKVPRPTKLPTSRSRGSSPAGWTRPTSRHWPGPRGPTRFPTQSRSTTSPSPPGRWRGIWGCGTGCGASAPASSGTPYPLCSTTWTSRWPTRPPWRSYFLNREAARGCEGRPLGRGRGRAVRRV